MGRKTVSCLTYFTDVFVSGNSKTAEKAKAPVKKPAPRSNAGKAKKVDPGKGAPEPSLDLSIAKVSKLLYEINAGSRKEK